MERMILLI